MNKIIIKGNDVYSLTSDEIYSLLYDFVPNHPNGTKFYWSANTLHRFAFKRMKDGFNNNIFETSLDLKRSTLFGIEIVFDRTDNEIHLLVKT